MNLDDLTIGEAKELKKIFGNGSPVFFDNGLIGKYVIVRASQAGVHAGVLEKHFGREAVLIKARRLWYWKPAEGKAFLSGVATVGVDHSASKIGVENVRVHLTEDCEIIECSDKATTSIMEAPEYVPE